MEKILITGGGGFIGSHLVEQCVENGYDVRVLVRYNSKNSWGWLENSFARDSVEIVAGDIRDYDSVEAVVKGCKSVFHLAALIGIPYSYVSPLAYIQTNIVGTYNVLQACLKNNVDSLLVTSTSETYGTAQYVPINEDHPLVGQSPYSASKIAADQLAISYYKSFNLPIKIVRPFNTYGPRQSARAVIPSIITQLLSGKEQIKLGNVTPTRDLTFVHDTVAGFLEVYRSEKLFGQATNVGMNEEISIGDLAQLIGELVGVPFTIITDNQRMRPDKSEVERLWCDNNKLLSTTLWKPSHTLKTGLQKTIDFLRTHMSEYKQNVYNV